jgi:hypothetical protein
MQGEVFTIVKVPLSEIEESIRLKHKLPEVLTDVQVEGDSLVLYFRDKPSAGYVQESIETSRSRAKKKRRVHRKRNRMRTRGWDIVARITNSKGQKCAIYKPFVNVLNVPLPEAEQKLAVAKILRSNGNRPSETSIQYFLENTLEYLKKQREQSQSQT